MAGVALSLAAGEGLLRFVYRDGGRLTLGAPGGQNFEHLAIRDRQRGRLDHGPRTAGVPRLMVLGDSITWGWGIRRWEDTWPEVLAREFEARGRPHQMAVLALAGRNIAAHLTELADWLDDVQPDSLVYQWHVNDIELNDRRPASVRWWQELGWHEALKAHSYLYYFLDNRFATFLPAPARSYLEYLLSDFVPGSVEWSDFERYFHALATRARERIPHRLLVLYPLVPFSGEYPLQSIHDRMRALARQTTLSIPPPAFVRQAGALVPRADAPWKQVIRLPRGAGDRAVSSNGYYARSPLDLSVRFAAPDLTPGSPAATLRVLDDATGEILAAAEVSSQVSGASLQEARLHLVWPADGARTVRLAIGPTAAADLHLASVDLVVEYGFEVLDLTESLNRFDTHVSPFDAHPNERAHKVIADEVFKRLSALEAAEPSTASPGARYRSATPEGATAIR